MKVARFASRTKSVMLRRKLSNLLITTITCSICVKEKIRSALSTRYSVFDDEG